MFNLIKMNLYRMVHAVSTWVLAIVAALLAFLDFGIMKIMVDDPFKLFGDAGSKMLGTTTITSRTTIAGFLISSDILIVLAIFVVIFANAEQKNGFDKNIIGITKMKWKHTVARWLSCVIGLTAIVAVSYGLYFGLSALFMNSFAMGSVAAYLKVLATVYFGLVAFSAIFFFFTTLFRSSVGGIVASLVMSLGVLSLLEKLLDFAVKKIFTSPKILPTDLLFDSAYINFDATSATTKACLILAGLSLAYIVLSVGGSALLQQKRDVK